MKEHDHSQTGSISYPEFKALLLDIDDVKRATHY